MEKLRFMEFDWPKATKPTNKRTESTDAQKWAARKQDDKIWGINIKFSWYVSNDIKKKNGMKLQF